MLNHVNTDIAVDVFEVLSELTDPEVLSSLPLLAPLVPRIDYTFTITRLPLFDSLFQLHRNAQ